MAKRTKIKIAPCSACSHTEGYQVPGTTSLYTCAKCDGLQGSCYMGDAYAHVALYQPMGESINGEENRYFDLTLIGSAGVQRVHGWYQPTTKQVIQYG